MTNLAASSNLEPGCFGSALAYADDAPACRHCRYQTSCKTKSLETKQYLINVLKIPEYKWRGPIKTAKEPSMKVTKASVASTPADSTPAIKIEPEFPAHFYALPKKSREHIERITRKKIDIVTAVQHRINPFAEGPEFLKVVFDHLYAGGFTRRGLANLLARKLSWSPPTAASHVSFVIPMLIYWGIVRESEGKIGLKE